MHVHIDLFRRIFIVWTIEEAGLPSELQPNRANFNLFLAVCGYLDAILCFLPCRRHEQCDQKVQLRLPLERMQVLNFEIYDSYLVMIYSLWPLHILYCLLVFVIQQKPQSQLAVSATGIFFLHFQFPLV